MYARIYVCMHRMYRPRGGWPIEEAGRKGSEKRFTCIYIYVELVKGSANFFSLRIFHKGAHWCSTRLGHRPFQLHKKNYFVAGSRKNRKTREFREILTACLLTNGQPQVSLFPLHVRTRLRHATADRSSGNRLECTCVSQFFPFLQIYTPAR